MPSSPDDWSLTSSGRCVRLVYVVCRQSEYLDHNAVGECWSKRLYHPNRQIIGVGSSVPLMWTMTLGLSFWPTLGSSTDCRSGDFIKLINKKPYFSALANELACVLVSYTGEPYIIVYQTRMAHDQCSCQSEVSMILTK